MNSEIAIEADDGSIDLAATWREAQEQLDDTDDSVAQAELGVEFAQVCGLAVHRGDDTTETTADALLGKFSKLSGTKKSNLRKNMDAKVEDLEEEEAEEEEKEEDEDSEPTLMGLVENHLDKLVIYQPADASADPAYSWRFSTGVDVETENQHRAPNSFAQKYHESSGGRFNPALPVDPSYKEDDWQWPQYIREVIKTHRENGDARIIEVSGVRSQAVDDLRRAVESKPATFDAAEAAQQQRAHIDPDDPNVVQVPNKVVDRVASQFQDCSFRDIEIELEERKARSGNVREIAVSDDATVRFWQISRAWFDDLDVPEEDDDTSDTAGVGDGE